MAKRNKLLDSPGIKRIVIKTTPLEYMLRVMCDPKVCEARRDRMAVAAAPYVHERKIAADTRVGKKELALVAARNPDAGTLLGELMVAKQELDKGREAVN